MKWSFALQNKAQIRNRINEKRVAISDADRNKAAQQAAHIFKTCPLLADVQHVACYLARTEEFDCSPIIKGLWESNKNCYLPVLSTKQEGHLDFVTYHPEDTVALNRYRILEPQHHNFFAPENLDLVLVPLVGFDMHGHRLGMGGGYFDRTFAFLQNNPIKKPLLIGLAYECQRMHNLPYDDWDVSLHGVLTEEKIILF